MLVDDDPRNQEVVFPYLNGQDFNSRPDQSPSRWVINFFDWEMERAKSYTSVFAIVKEKVLPERLKIKHEGTRKKGSEYFWRYDSQAKELYQTIAPLKRVIVKSEVGNMLSFALVPNKCVFSHMVIVFPFDAFFAVALLQSSLHEVWARQYGSSMRTDLRYTPSSCFDTFSFPLAPINLELIGKKYHEHRRGILLKRQEGLTQTYNRFHDPDETEADIRILRELHVEMDKAVAAAYGWIDLDLGHGFHETKQGLRFTISESARREVLGRLLKLNHERYAEEARQGLHEKKKPRNTRKTRKKGEEGSGLFG